MRITAGRLRGRSIPFLNRKYGNADITPQKVKEALFSMLGEELRARPFLDLFACSGQIGLEALSRGAEPVILNETDKRRFLFIKSLVREWGMEEKTLVRNFRARQCIRYLHQKGIRPGYIFIDAPYIKEKGPVPYYSDLLNFMAGSGILEKDSIIIIQHYSKNILPETAGDLTLRETRDYGTTSLSFYAPAENT